MLAADANSVNLSVTSADFADKNVGTSKTVTATGLSLTGNKASNYKLASTTATTNSDISAKGLTAGVTADDKVYNGSTAAVTHVTLGPGVVAGDVVGVVDGTGTFASKNVVGSQTVTDSGIALSGADKANYTFNATATATAKITARTVIGHITAQGKAYDGTTSATVLTHTLTNVVGSEDVGLTVGAAGFADRNVGAAKTVTASGLSLSGTDKGNYVLDAAAVTATADITPKGLLASITPQTKIYDGSGTAALTLTDFILSGLVGTEGFAVTKASGAYSIVNVGTGTVSANLAPADFTPAPGTLAGNYTLPTSALGSGQITAKVLTPSITANNKTYDGSTTATLSSQTLSGVVPAEVGNVSLTLTSANFDTPSVGMGKTVTATGLGLDGTAAGNYTLGTTTSVTTTANIGQATPTVSATNNGGTYNGSTFAATAATVTGVGSTTLASFGDPTLTYHYYAGTLTTPSQLTAATELSGGAPKDAGLYTVVARYASADTNYKSADSAPVNFTIAKAASTTVVTIVGAPFTYTGAAQTPATVKVTGAGGLSLAPTAGYADNTNAGTATASYAYAGDDNHTGSSDSQTFTIAKADAVISVTGYSVTYDGNAHTATGSASGVEATPADLTGLLHLGGTTHTNATAGTVSDAWTFDGNGNYKATSGTVNDAIAKAASTTVVTIVGAPFTYTGAAQTPATVKVTGAGGLGLTPAAVYTSNVNAGTATASYTYAGDANHEVSSDSKTFTVLAKAASVTPTAGQHKTYGAADPALMGSLTGFLAGDNVTAIYSRAAGETVLGGPYTISARLTPTAVLSNYAITYNTASFTIDARAITVTAAAKSKVYGNPDPALTYSITTGTLVGTDAFTGSLSRVTGENVGPYAITQGSLALSSNYALTYAGANLTVTAAPLTMSAINVLTTPNPVGTTINVSATFSDTGFSTSPSVTLTWSDGTITPVTLGGPSSGDYSVTGSRTFNATGVYTVTLTAKDAGGSTISTTSGLVVIYDPSAGFVTGGGWIISPAGAYAANPSLTGKANFGFESKYQKGSNVPTGNTEFQFQLASLNFKSTSYEWLVVAGARAQYKGVGTINGTGNYGFLLTAIDGSVSGGGGVDKFRIKIWNINNAGAIVYDNQIGKSDTGDDATALDGTNGNGSIVIHDANAKKLQSLAGPAEGTGSTQVLTQEQLQPIVAEAIARWQAAGIGEANLNALLNTRVLIADLEDGDLGQADTGSIVVDQDADGHGWFIDTTPGDDSEFTPGIESPAKDRMDLLSAVMHEMGHLLGYGHDDGDDLMHESLAVGVRHGVGEDHHAVAVQVDGLASEIVAGSTSPVAITASAPVVEERVFQGATQALADGPAQTVAVGLDAGSEPGPSSGRRSHHAFASRMSRRDRVNQIVTNFLNKRRGGSSLHDQALEQIQVKGQRPGRGNQG